jgi:hypothetical protein
LHLSLSHVHDDPQNAGESFGPGFLFSFFGYAGKALRWNSEDWMFGVWERKMKGKRNLSSNFDSIEKEHVMAGFA